MTSLPSSSSLLMVGLDGGPQIPVGLLVLIALVLGVGLAARLLWEHLRQGHKTPRAGLWRRVRLRRHPGAGFAGRWELWRRYGLGLPARSPGSPGPA